MSVETDLADDGRCDDSVSKYPRRNGRIARLVVSPITSIGSYARTASTCISDYPMYSK